MLATAAALLLAFVPGDAPVRFAPAAHRLLTQDPVDEPLYFPPTADQVMAEAGAPGMVPFWGGFGVSLLIDGAVFVGGMLVSAFRSDAAVAWAAGIGAVVEILLKPLLIALTESNLAKDPRLFWPAAGAAFIGGIAAAALFGLSLMTWSMGGDNTASTMFGVASGIALVVGAPGLTAMPVAWRWSF